MAQAIETATILIFNFGVLLNEAEHYVQRWEEYLVSDYQRIVDDVPYSAKQQILPEMTVFLCAMLSSFTTIPHV